MGLARWCGLLIVPPSLPMRLLLLLPWLLSPALATAQIASPAEDEKTQGQWNPPPSTRPVWTSAATELRFPVTFSDYRMQGVFDFKDEPGSHIVRYESASARARGDIFIRRQEPAPTDPSAIEDAINAALIQAVDDLASMTEQGRYEDLKDDGPLEGRIELWKQDPLPLYIQQFSATRIGQREGKPEKVPLKLWYGCTVFKGHVLLIRHLRPADAADQGTADMKFFVDAILRVIKDPPLRPEMRTAMETFVRQPLTESGQEAAKIVLGYLDNSPMVPVLMPAAPLTTWADEMEKLVPNSGSQLLRGYVISGALAALNDQDHRACLTLACQQVIRIYLEIQRLNKTVIHEGLESLARMVERGEAAAWMEKQIADAAAKAQP